MTDLNVSIRASTFLDRVEEVALMRVFKTLGVQMLDKLVATAEDSDALPPVGQHAFGPIEELTISVRVMPVG